MALEKYKHWNHSDLWDFNHFKTWGLEEGGMWKKWGIDHPCKKKKKKTPKWYLEIQMLKELDFPFFLLHLCHS